MRLDFYIDPVTGEPHICRHGVNESEVEQVLSKPGLEFESQGGIRIVIGQTDAGRFLQVVFRNRIDGVTFVITAYRPNRGAMKAFRRHTKHRGR